MWEIVENEHNNFLQLCFLMGTMKTLISKLNKNLTFKQFLILLFMDLCIWINARKKLTATTSIIGASLLIPTERHPCFSKRKKMFEKILNLLSFIDQKYSALFYTSGDREKIILMTDNLREERWSEVEETYMLLSSVFDFLSFIFISD